jgi:ribA/ribD-fused uncharacterized protein
MALEPKIIAFTSVRLAYGWLGNMSPHPIQFDGMEWRTAEALFQALRFDDAEIKEAIRAKKAPMAAKFVARANKDKMVVQPQSPADLENMRRVLRLKLRQHPELRQKLYDTGDATIIEDCTSRTRASGKFWGAALQEGQWVGENQLGKLWMELRDELRARRPESN